MINRRALLIGHFGPVQNAHVAFPRYLLEVLGFERLGIGFGSCYTYGFGRFGIPAFLREKMYLYSLNEAGLDLSRIDTAHLPDSKDDWLGWWSWVLMLQARFQSDTLASGNPNIID